MVNKKAIDVSDFQDSINWTKIKASGIDYAIIKSSLGSDSPSQIDAYFFQNADGCIKNNIAFGTYHMAYFVDVKTAKEEADFATKMANNYKDKVQFIALDIEEDTERYAKQMGCNPNWTECCLVFLERVKSNGYVPVLYSNQNWIENKLDYNKFKNYKLWYAAYGASNPKYKCAIWQYSDGTKIDGIEGCVDMNIVYDTSIFNKTSITKRTSNNSVVDDKTKFINVAKNYIGVNGDYVCNKKLGLGAIYDWCAFAISSIMKDCGFIGKYIKAIEGGAGSIPRASDGKYGVWFKKGTMAIQPGDLFFLRYANYPRQDKYFCDHIGIVESVNGNTITTLEGNVDGDNSNWATTSVFKRKTRLLTDNIVYAFYRPKWQATVKTTSATMITKANSTKSKTNTNTITGINSAKTVNYRVKVTANDGVNIREGASTSKKILGAVPCNTVLKITKETGSGNYTWGLVAYKGITGWIAIDFTERINAIIEEGDRVKVQSNAVIYGTNTKLSSFVYKTIFQVMEISDNRVVIGNNGQITAAIDKKYLIKVED